MLRFMIWFQVWILNTALTCCRDNSSVLRFSVPEDHHVRLKCSGSDDSDVVWTHQGRRVPVFWQGGYETNADPEHYHLQSDGSLVLWGLHKSDSGDYHCNHRLEAELQVLTGPDFLVSAGRTLLLPCRGPSRLKQRWFHRRWSGGHRELILTCFGHGTLKPVREGGRFSCGDEALHIQDLQPEDAGEYLCKGNLQARLSVLSVLPEPTSLLHTCTPATPATPATPEVIVTDKKKKKKKKRRTVVLLMVAVVVFGLMILVLVALCVFLVSRKCRRKTRTASARRDDSELQTWDTSITHSDWGVRDSPPPPQDTIHYASLGRQNWRDRPSRTPPDQDHHRVIYSSVITRPAAR